MPLPTFSSERILELFEALPTITENNLGSNTVTGNWPAQQEAGEEELPYPAEALLTLLAAGLCLLKTLQVMEQHLLLHASFEGVILKLKPPKLQATHNLHQTDSIQFC